MKFTSEDLMKAMGLQVGDRISIEFKYPSMVKETMVTEEQTVEVVCDNNWGVGFEHDGVVVPIERLLNKEYKILPRPKRVGDLKCEELTCATCPLRVINCVNITTSVEKTLYQILGEFLPKYQDQEIYDLLKARLDKEVEE